MSDAHRLWHQALESYFDPDSFRVALQNCIQTLRSVTWLLQSQKAGIPNFEEWYAPWQDRMRADPILKWLVKARNRIEKQGDLESKSFVRVAIIASYLNELPVLEVEAKIFDGLDTLFSKIPRDTLEKQVLKHGSLRIERRWIIDDLPNHEVLDALGYVFGQLSLLLDDAHRHLGLPVPVTMIDQDGTTCPAPGGGPADGRLPCMVSDNDLRVCLFSLQTGQQFDVVTKRMHPPIATRKEIEERYGPVKTSEFPNKIETFLDLSKMYFLMARRIFEKDGYHSSMAFLFKSNAPILHIETPVEDRSQKYLLMRKLASEVKRTNADSIVMIGEVWQSQMDPREPYLYPSDVPDRTEHLSLWACSEKSGDIFLNADIIRNGDKVALGDTTVEDIGSFVLFKPIREVWRHKNG